MIKGRRQSLTASHVTPTLSGFQQQELRRMGAIREKDPSKNRYAMSVVDHLDHARWAYTFIDRSKKQEIPPEESCPILTDLYDSHTAQDQM